MSESEQLEHGSRSWSESETVGQTSSSNATMLSKLWPYAWGCSGGCAEVRLEAEGVSVRHCHATLLLQYYHCAAAEKGLV